MVLKNFIFGIVITFLMTGAKCQVIDVIAEADSQAVLPCKYKPNSIYSPAVIWSKVNNGTIWKKKKSGLQFWGSDWSVKGNQRARCPHYEFSRGDYSLQIKNVREGDGGLFSCTVQTGDQVIIILVMLRIIKVSSSPSFPILDNSFSISCNVTPWPYGASVQWIVNNSSFMQQMEITSDGETINNVVRERATPRLAGNWTCVVGYEGKVGRASATLTMKGITKPFEDNTKVYAPVGSEVTLPCVFSSGLVPSSPAWEKLKPSPILLPASFSPSQPVMDKSITLKEVQLEDEGMYRCSGTVSGQRLTRNMELVVAKIDSSFPSKERGYVSLTCKLTNTSEVTEYEWVRVVYDHNGNQSVESIQKGKFITINKMSVENQGEWACRFYGKYGILGNVTYHIQIMSGLSGQISSGLSQNTGALVGLSVLLVFLLLVLTKMYTNYQRRNQILQYPALETIVHTISNEREQRERNREKK